MPKGRPFKLPGFRAWVELISQTAAKAAAEQIVKDLIVEGPWYSGQFAKNWVVKPGDVRIPATVEPERVPARTTREEVKIPVVKSLRGTGSKNMVGYTIDNRTTYRRIAMDLVPGRVITAKTISAKQDWFRSYVEGQGLRTALGLAVDETAKNPKIRGFSGSRFIGPSPPIVNR